MKASMYPPIMTFISFFCGILLMRAWQESPKDVTNPKTPTSFALQIDAKDSEIVAAQKEMYNFGKELQAVMGLTDAQVELANLHEQSWTVENYEIAARNFAHHEAHGEWVTLVYAVPLSAGTTRVGFSNVPVGFLSDGWRYYPKGTGTIIVPSEGIQQAILEEVRKMAK